MRAVSGKRKGFQFYFRCNAIIYYLDYKLWVCYKLQVQANLVLLWFIHVVDNFNVKTNLICNVSLFQQTNMVRTQMHFYM